MEDHQIQTKFGVYATTAHIGAGTVWAAVHINF